VHELGYPAPKGSHRWKFNVYVGDSGVSTGTGELTAFAAAGYFMLDPDGLPMIVLAPETLSNRNSGHTTAAHELYHALQNAMGQWFYTDQSAWYWEATATWVEKVVYPEDSSYAAFLYGYALLPHLPMWFFDFPDSADLTEYHQYGAFIFPLFLTEQVADVDLIRRSWEEVPDGVDHPIAALRHHVEARGLDFDESLGDFAAANAVWDYEDGDLYEQVVDLGARRFPRQDWRLTAEVGASGTDGWQRPDEELLPGSYGSNTLRMLIPEEGGLHIQVELDAAGSEGTPADAQLRLVVLGEAGHRVERWELEQGRSSVEWWPSPGDEELRLTLMVVADGGVYESFGWSWAVTPLLPEADSAAPEAEPRKTSSGCAQLPTWGAGLWLALLALLQRWRR
jgi:hypothetical protein